MLKRVWRFSLIKICMLMLLLTSWQAFASCSQNPVAGTKFITAPGTISINPYQTNGLPVANGTVLYTGTFTGNTGNFTVTCTAAFTGLLYQGIGTATANVYPTSIPGIGMEIHNTGSANDNLWPAAVTVASSTSYSSTASAEVTLQLVKTGPITTGGTLSGTVGNYVIPTQANYSIFPIALTGVTIVGLTQPTCVVTSTTINVALGNFAINHFPAIGSTSPPMPFNIQLVCSGGPGVTTTTMSTVLTDATNSANTSNTLPLSASSTATGLGVQITYNGAIVSYAADPSVNPVATFVPPYPNQVTLGTGENGTYNFPFYAHYIRTGTVTAGTANSSATFTIIYK
ncbi:fimbrial protein [Solimicrobium silvestre]|uniref:Fimbrial protein n=1 Tax=Solimicrobium silvestre TaxID=2099400 RepID=A0A2S9H034_9BURK|nr:fimbrial protein [Solimicrobium silvestre]PRC93349.1 Fimbrial protein [Solimicrobium silvestre]